MSTFPWKYELSDHSCSIYAGDLLSKYTNVSGTPLQIEAVTDTTLRIHARTLESFAVEQRPKLTGTLTAVSPSDDLPQEKTACDAALRTAFTGTASSDASQNNQSLLTFATKTLQISLDDELHLQICSVDGTPLCSVFRCGRNTSLLRLHRKTAGSRIPDRGGDRTDASGGTCSPCRG